jgi:hypothetical protein
MHGSRDFGVRGGHVQRIEREEERKKNLFELLPLAAATLDEEARCRGGVDRAGERR